MALGNLAAAPGKGEARAGAAGSVGTAGGVVRARGGEASSLGARSGSNRSSSFLVAYIYNFRLDQGVERTSVLPVFTAAEFTAIEFSNFEGKYGALIGAPPRAQIR